MRIRIPMSIMQALIIVAMLVPPGAASRTFKAKPPEPMSAGPFPVGVTTTIFVDDRRMDSFTKQPRTPVTEIWYPATDDARRMPKNKYSDHTGNARWTIINSYSVAFLGYFLKGKKEYASFLSDNHWPDVMVWDVKGVPGRRASQITKFQVKGNQADIRIGYR
jgi:hypothetical protein